MDRGQVRADDTLNAGKFCQKCYNDYDKYSKLRTELLERLQIAFDKISPVCHDPAPETSKRKRKEVVEMYVLREKNLG